jgi:ribosomal protein L11 methyltransferase
MAEVRWLEASLLVDYELAEAVAEVLSRFVSNGVVVERDITFQNAEDPGTPLDWARVYGYMAVDEKIEEARQGLNEALWYLGRIRPLPEPVFRPVEDEDWMAAWKKHYRPIIIGEKLLILPAWIEQSDPQRIAVRIDPGMAFGTGTHPSTQLCLELIETYTRPGHPVIDVGCGSGILSIAALKLGASHALAVDIDNAAVMGTNLNAAANVVESQVETGVGSVAEILNGRFSLRKAPLVLANILATVLIELLENGLAELVSEDGILILAGILEEQADSVGSVAVGQGLKLASKCQKGDWVALAYQRV